MAHILVLEWMSFQEGGPWAANPSPGMTTMTVIYSRVACPREMTVIGDISDLFSCLSPH